MTASRTERQRALRRSWWSRVGRPLHEVELDSYDFLPRSIAERVRVVHIARFPGPYVGITLGRLVVLARPEPEDGSSRLLAHELVHVVQWHELGRRRFVRTYVADFARGVKQHRNWNAAYSQIPAEVEARLVSREWAERALQ